MNKATCEERKAKHEKFFTAWASKEMIYFAQGKKAILKLFLGDFAFKELSYV